MARLGARPNAEPTSKPRLMRPARNPGWRGEHGQAPLAPAGGLKTGGPCSTP